MRKRAKIITSLGLRRRRQNKNYINGRLTEMKNTRKMIETRRKKGKKNK